MSGTGFFDYGTDVGGAAPTHRFLAEADDDDWEMVVAHCERRRFRRGEAVVNVGDVDRSLLIVLEGDLETVVTRRGKHRRLSQAPAGSVVGELGFLDGQPRSANVIAATGGELLRMSLPSFESLAAANPRLGRLILFDLALILAARLRALNEVVMAR